MGIFNKIMAKKKPITSPEGNDKRKWSSPIKFRKFYLKHIFNKNKEAYNDFVKAYEKALSEARVFAVNVAWIYFRELWYESDSGWMKRLIKES